MKHTCVNISLGSHYVHIGLDLAKKTLPIRLPDPLNLHGYIRFPRLRYLPSEQDTTPNAELIHPVAWEDCGESASSEYYGSISYLVHNNEYTPLLSIRQFVVDIESTDYLQEQTIKDIKEIVSKSVDNTMCLLSIIHPECISSKENPKSYRFVASCAANYDQQKGNRMIETGGTVFVMLAHKTIQPSVLFPILRESHKELTLQYQLLAELKEFLARGDYRSCILHASTIFETTLLQLVDAYLVSNDIPSDLTEFVHRKIGGIASYDYFYKKNIIAKCSDPRVKATNELRNKVIHEGRTVTNQEATDAYNAAFEFLKFYNWKYFVE